MNKRLWLLAMAGVTAWTLSGCAAMSAQPSIADTLASTPGVVHTRATRAASRHDRRPER